MKVAALRTATILLLGAALLAGIHVQHAGVIETLRAAHRREADQRAIHAVESLRETFVALYQGLRTIARFPAVRDIGRHAEGLEGDTRTAVQELYNNLAGNVALSEVYIVPAGFDPDRVDPATGTLEVPITTFDSLIIGRNADDAHEAEHESDHEVEEIEIFEYRLMREQLAWLSEHVPDEGRVQGLSYPAIVGREVVTCDNTRFSPSAPNDRDRSGLVYSVPFYRRDGRLGGMVSGIVLTRAVEDIFAGTAVVLRNPEYGLTIGADAHPLREASASAIARVAPDARLVYSNVFPLEVRDDRGSWQLWSGLPDSAFWGRTDVQAARLTAVLQAIVVVLGTLMVLVVMRVAAEARKRRSAEEHALLADERTRMASLKTQFIAQASHDFRTPLAMIRAASDVLRRYSDRLSPSQRTDRLDRIDEAVRQIDELIDDVMIFGRAEAGRLASRAESTDVPDLCERALDQVRALASANHELLLHVRAPITTAHVDPKLLRRVLDNLLTNAVKYSPAGGPIDLEVDREDGLLTFRVSDRGIGISEKDQAHLGELFHRGENTGAIDGTGLGLAIARKAVESQGGRFEVSSEVGVGTTVLVALPDDPATA